MTAPAVIRAPAAVAAERAAEEAGPIDEDLFGRRDLQAIVTAPPVDSIGPIDLTEIEISTQETKTPF